MAYMTGMNDVEAAMAMNDGFAGGARFGSNL